MTSDRYNRQVILDSFGAEGQSKLADTTIAIVGLGALGTHHAQTFARMGVGKLVLIDRDLVELDNLNRQVLFIEQDASAKLPKSIAAYRHLQKINSEIEYEVFVDHLGPMNIRKLLTGADLIIDGSDNFTTRYLLNDFSRKHDIPYVYCGVVGYEASSFPIIPGGPCLRCIFRDMPDPSREPACDTAGVWPPAVGIISGYATDMALRIILADTPTGGWPAYFLDIRDCSPVCKIIAGMKSEDCPSCGGKYDFLDSDDTNPVHVCGTAAYQVFGAGGEIDFEQIRKKLAGTARISGGEFFLGIELADGVSLSVFHDGRALVRGPDSPGVARAIYDKYIGS